MRILDVTGIIARMDKQDELDNRVYVVVMNDEEQYSIWPEVRELPPGWHAEGTRGSREECLAHIDRVWVDITPASVRRALAQQRSEGATPQA